MRTLRNALIRLLIGADVKMASLALIESLRHAGSLPEKDQQAVIEHEIYYSASRPSLGLRLGFKICITCLTVSTDGETK